jgi:hypothetical protein
MAELFSNQFLLLNDDLRGFLIDWNRVFILVDLARVLPANVVAAGGGTLIRRV